jgi:Saccharopine dehydrogenase NADP binding domain
MPSTSQAKPYDLVVFGASSFVGKLVTKYLLERYGAKPSTFKWALAARSREKLEDVKKELKADSLPLIIADASDEKSLKAMLTQTRVCITVVGPYTRYGEQLVRVASKNGVHLLDLTGETLWVKKVRHTHKCSICCRSYTTHTIPCGKRSWSSTIALFHLSRSSSTCNNPFFKAHSPLRAVLTVLADGGVVPQRRSTQRC